MQKLSDTLDLATEHFDNFKPIFDFIASSV